MTRSFRRLLLGAVGASAAVLLAGAGPAAACSSVPPGAVIRTVAGTGVTGYTGDGLPAVGAQLSNVEAVAYDAQGRLLIVDTYNNAVRRVDRSGVVTTVVTPSAGLLFPFAIAVRGSTVYLADTYHQRIVRVNTDGSLTVVAGTGVAGYSGDGGPATAAQLDYPFGLSVADDGTLLVADTFNNRIRRVDPASGRITTVAGTGERGDGGDGGRATLARLALPYSVAAEADGSYVIADTDNNKVRTVSRHGVITTLAGTGAEGFNGDGQPAAKATLASPGGVAVDLWGDVYIADTDNNRVRVVEHGRIRTVAGDGVEGFAGDGGPATGAEIDIRGGIAVSRLGTSLAIADTWNARVRQVSVR